MTESLDIMFVIESTFSDYKPLLPQRSTKEFQEIPYFLQLERKFMGAWLRLITNPGGDLRNFEKILDETNSSLEKFDGPYFLGTEVRIFPFSQNLESGFFSRTSHCPMLSHLQ